MFSKVRKKVVYLTIFLIIGLSVTNSINGELNKQQLSKNPILMDYNYDDYQIGYWKLDEGSGYTAEDSSGNNYDGTIYGASWITGYSGYALHFDGSNDYIALDDYSNQLGFNKTDDMIFSLYFKTSTTERGILYSASHHWDYNPGVHIAMDEDGKLEFRLWVLGCGVSLKTEGVYNNGEWHYLEIWYNGVSANPIITIYVDNEEDITVQHWVCSFEYSEFERDKIGRRGLNQTGYYLGDIDEFKIYKFPGGNQQNPPEISGPSTGKINQNLDYTFTTNDPEQDEIYIFIDWGDGNDTGWIGPYDSGKEVTKTHKYTKNGSYDIKSKSKDIWDDSTWSYKKVRIGNQAPSTPTISGIQYGEPGSLYKFSFKSSDFEGDNVWYWIDWGDGNIDEWIGGEDGYEQNVTVDVYHDWDEKGFYDITAKSRDVWGQESQENTFPIRIGNEKPEKPSITGSQVCKLDEEYEYTFLSSDYEEDTITYFINWGDGHDSEVGPVSSGDPIKVKKIWNNKGTFTIKAKVQDQIGDYSEEGTLIVSAPKSKGFYFSLNILQWIFQHFPYEFPILKNLIGVIN